MVFSLNGESYTYIDFIVPRSRRPRVHYIVEAEHAIAVYLLDSQGLANFENGMPFDSYAGHGRRTYHDEIVTLPFAGEWYLLIWNTSNTPIAIHYELYV